MKKLLYIVIGFALAVGVFGIGGLVYAQTQGPDGTAFPCPFCDGDGDGHFGRGGMMGGRFEGRGDFGPGMMSDFDGETGPMHEAMSTAIADAFDMTVEELEALHTEGTTLWDYAESQGMSAEDFQTLMLDARQIALTQAVADGILTQEQADWMQERMAKFGSQMPFGQGGRGRHGCRNSDQ